MIVVSDTSPLNYLILIDAIELLPELFKEIHAPAFVVEELQALEAPELVKRWAALPPPWLKITTPTLTITASVRLDLGELQAIALAKELGAATLLIDERKGRRIAKQYGLRAVGTLAVLELAAAQNLIDIRRALESLRQTTFYISDDYIDAALKRDAARRSQ